MKAQQLLRSPCALCGENNFDLLYPLNGFKVVRCKQCGLVTTSLPISRTDLEKMYGSPYYEERREYYFENCVTNRTIAEENSSVQDFRRGLLLIEKYKSGGTLLDVGCGLGVFLALAREHGWETCGIDISSYATSYARQSFGLEVHTGGLHDAQFPHKKFDVITLWDVLEHFPDPAEQLREIHRVLKDDGIIFLNTPNEAGLLRVLARFIFRLSSGKIDYPVRKLYHQYHICYFTPQTFITLLDKTGFELKYIERKGIPIVKARGRPFERMLVKALSWPEQLCHREYELLAIAQKKL